jgi:hypothetical protein
LIMTMATFSMSVEAQQAAVLLEGYRFELGDHDARQWVSLWLEYYRPSWIRDAVVEALYQGRYKSVSVRQILELWQRRGQPIRHVTHDFEAAVCREFGEIKAAPMPVAASVQHRSIRVQESRSPDENGAPRHPLRANASVSFNLSTMPLVSPGMAPTSDMHSDISSDISPQHQGLSEGVFPAETPEKASPANTAESNRNSKAKRTALDHKAWREFSSYTTPTYANIDAEDDLDAQRQFKGVLYSSAKAIQPFKPALPFSAQTLRLAKQKAIASMADAR